MFKHAVRISSVLAGLAVAACAQNAAPATQNGAPSDLKAAAYYHYSLGHLYAELAGAYGNRSDYFSKAIDNLKQAIKDDPSATFISEELSDLYIQSGRLRDAVVEGEEAVKQNPKDVNARRVLARIYTRMIGDSRENRVDENMLHKAIDQYQQITAADPKDGDSWLMLGRLQKIAQNSTEAEKAYKQALAIDPNNEDALTGLALVYSDLGQNDKAADLFRQAAEKNPNPHSLAALASAYEQMRDYSLAAETFKRALQLNPGNADIKRAMAQDLLLSDQLDQAEKAYQELVAQDTKDAQSWLRLSQIYRQKRQFDKAHEAAETAKKLEPDNLEIRYNDVALLAAEGKTSAAIDALRNMLASTAKKSYATGERASRASLLERLAFLYRQNDQYPEAIDAFQQAADLDPSLGARAMAQMVETYRAAKDFTKAQETIDRASEKYPKDPVVISQRAMLLADLGKTDAAVAEARKLLDGKDDRDTWLQIAQIYSKGKNYDGMANALDEAEKLSKTNDDKEAVYFLRGDMYEHQKKYDEAEAEFRKVLQMNPRNSSAMNYLGYMLAERNVRLPEAHELISKALDREPNNGAYLDSLGWVYFKMNKLPEAEEQLKRALSMMASDPTVHDHLGDVYFHEGKLRDAILQWESSLQNYKTSAPSDQDPTDVAKIQKKLEGAKVRLARETGTK